MTEETHLSDREKEVLCLVAEGMTNREIAQRLTISPNTVKVHLSNIFEKAGVASRTEASMYAIEHRIVEVPGGEGAAANAPEPGFWQMVARLRWVWIGIGLLLIAFLVISSAIIRRRERALQTMAAAEVAERWQELAPMPEPRAGMAAVAYDGDIYTIAGEGPAGVSGSVFRYLPEEDRWETLRDKPTPVTDVEGVLIGEKVYVPGGMGADGQPVDLLEIYDPRQDTWHTGTPLPSPVSDYALADFEGKMYLFGGWDGEEALDVVWVYDPAEDGWGRGTAIPNKIQHPQVVVVGESILLSGKIVAENRSEKKNIDITLRFSVFNDKSGINPWEKLVLFDEFDSKIGAVSLADNVFLFINETRDSSTFMTPIVLNRTNDNWLWLESKEISPLNKNGIVVLSNKIHILGGAGLENILSSNHLSFQAIYSVSIPILPR